MLKEFIGKRVNARTRDGQNISGIVVKWTKKGIVTIRLVDGSTTTVRNNTVDVLD